MNGYLELVAWCGEPRISLTTKRAAFVLSVRPEIGQSSLRLKGVKDVLKRKLTEQASALKSKSDGAKSKK